MGKQLSDTMMKVLSVLFLVFYAGNGFPEEKMMCSESIHEMHTLGGMVKLGAAEIQSYLVDNCCPTLPTVHDQELCVNYEADYYIEMLEAIVNHFFIDGATHICQVMGMCDVRRYTCEECVEGLEWVKAYMLDPIMVAEFTIYLIHDYCLSDWPYCKEDVAKYFPGMHQMAMEKFMIPVGFVTNSLFVGWILQRNLLKLKS